MSSGSERRVLSELLTARVTPQMQAEVALAAHDAGVSLGEYVRHAALMFARGLVACCDPDCDCADEPAEYERPMITINPDVRYL